VLRSELLSRSGVVVTDVPYRLDEEPGGIHGLPTEGGT